MLVSLLKFTTLAQLQPKADQPRAGGYKQTILLITGAAFLGCLAKRPGRATGRRLARMRCLAVQYSHAMFFR